MNLAAAHASRIRTLHEEAHALAGKAIDKAIECGCLLTKVKDSLPHGQFGSWLAENCGFSDRTARRYMTLHSRKESLPEGVGIRAALAHFKTDTVSDSESWLPIDGAVGHTDRLGTAFRVWRVGEYAHAVRLVGTGDGGCTVDATRRPVRLDVIESVLAQLGLPAAAEKEWLPANRYEAEAFRSTACEVMA